jgi:transcription-repair coupling factor (superfamily II helicase)
LYKRIANTQSDAELKELQVELIDRFGLLPAPLKHLIRQTRLRQRAEQLGINRLEAGEKRGRIIFDAHTQVDPYTLVTLIQSSPQHYRLDGSDTLRFELDMEKVDQRFEHIESLLTTLNQKVAAA